MSVGEFDPTPRVCQHDFTRLQRLVFWLFARPINRAVSKLLGEAYNRGLIDSRAMHWLCAFFDPTQRNPQVNWPFCQPERAARPAGKAEAGAM